MGEKRKKWNPREAVPHAQGALQHTDIIGQVQRGRPGLGLGNSWKTWGKSTLPERRQMVTSFVHEQEEETRRAASASQAKQGQWMDWHGVETRKISWRL